MQTLDFLIVYGNFILEIRVIKEGDFPSFKEN